MVIFTYIPNCIGYLRFLFTFLAVKYAYDPALESWLKFVVLYSVSQMLDGIDG